MGTGEDSVTLHVRFTVHWGLCTQPCILHSTWFACHLYQQWSTSSMSIHSCPYLWKGQYCTSLLPTVFHFHSPCPPLFTYFHTPHPFRWISINNQHICLSSWIISIIPLLFHFTFQLLMFMQATLRSSFFLLLPSPGKVGNPLQLYPFIIHYQGNQQQLAGLAQ